VGWKCKRLIDYGRQQYLQHHGMAANLKIYIDAQQTPENVVLLAVPAIKS
jgi:tRNA:m4X modification enzyme